MAEVLTRQERRKISARISAALCNQLNVTIYWLPTKRCITARSPVSQRPRPVPSDAVEIGRYVHGIAASCVIEDLHDALASMRSRPAPAAPPVAVVAAPRPVPETSLKWAPPRTLWGMGTPGRRPRRAPPERG